ncbi:MAG TPA: winged helix-turn-helix domain-containing protein, partial [Atopostipes sp.]|nr:winged helix-turn-helix domain-containing protein [Atopostipes sp.]
MNSFETRENMLLHRRIYHELKDFITSGDLKPGEKLPKQDVISKTFDTSRVTVQKAINLLKAEDLVYTVKGQGTFVTETVDRSSLLDSNIDEYFGFSTNYKKQESIQNEV